MKVNFFIQCAPKSHAAPEIGGLARGVYFLKIKFEQGEISRKIVVE